MSLIRTTAELTPYVNFDVNMKFAKIKPSIETAEHDLVKPLLGQAFYDELHTAYLLTPGTPLSAELAAVLPYVQKTLALYAAFASVENLGVSVGDAGIQQQTTINSQPAPAWKVKDLKIKYLNDGDRSADLLLEFLEYAAVIPDGQTEDDRLYKKWYDSEANPLLDGCIVYKTTLANKYIDILNSRRLFLRLKKRIREIELGIIKRIICKEQYEELIKQIKGEEEYSDENKALVEMLEPIICKRALYSTLPMLPVIITADGLFLQTSNDSVIQKLQATITEKSAYMEQLKDAEDIGYLANEAALHTFIKENISNYGKISGSPCWTAEVSDTNEKWKIDNDPCNKHFST